MSANRIRVGAESLPKLVALAKPLIITDMYYKLRPKYSEGHVNPKYKA